MSDDTSLHASIKRDRRQTMALRSAQHIVHGVLRDYISPRAVPDAVEELAKALHREGMELISREQRELYEEWLRQQQLTLLPATFSPNIAGTGDLNIPVKK